METPDTSAATHLVAFTTAPSAEDGRRLARALVENGMLLALPVVRGVEPYFWVNDLTFRAATKKE
jgi:uncharacterized protein involved in tolerance to divalent cations